MEKRVPDWLLERFALGELPPDELAAVRRRLDAEEGGRERLAALERSNHEILGTYDAATIAASIRRRTDGAEALSLGHQAESGVDPAKGADPAPSRPWPSIVPASRAPVGADGGWWRKLAVGGGFAIPVAAAILLVAVLPQGELATDPVLSELEETRLKGLRPQLLVHRRGAEAPERLGDGSEVRAHELLQLSYVAAGEGYGVVLSLDGAGAVTLHHPLAGGLASPLQREGAVPLPNAYELDDAPGFERFILISSKEPFPVQEALDAARRLAGSPAAAAHDPLPLPGDREQTSLTLRKPR